MKRRILFSIFLLTIPFISCLVVPTILGLQGFQNISSYGAISYIRQGLYIHSTTEKHYIINRLEVAFYNFSDKKGLPWHPSGNYRLDQEGLCFRDTGFLTTRNYATTKVLFLPIKEGTSWQNFFWTIGDDRQTNYVVLRLHPTGVVKYRLWNENGGYREISVGKIRILDLRVLMISVMQEGSAFNVFSAVIYQNGTISYLQNSIIPYEPDYACGRFYIDALNPNLTLEGVAFTNATIADFHAYIYPNLDKINIHELQPDIMEGNLLDNDTASFNGTGWYGYSGLYYWNYDYELYRSPPSSARINYDADVPDRSIWSKRQYLNDDKPWVFFSAWLYLEADMNASARVGIDFRQEEDILYAISGESILKYREWVHVAAWGYSRNDAEYVVPWVQLLECNLGCHVLIDDATLICTDKPAVKYDVYSEVNEAGVRIKFCDAILNEVKIMGETWYDFYPDRNLVLVPTGRYIMELVFGTL